jgi:hypothetical protein
VSPESSRKHGSVKGSSALQPSVGKWFEPPTSAVACCTRTLYDPQWSVVAKTACLNKRSLCLGCLRSKASSLYL